MHLFARIIDYAFVLRWQFRAAWHYLTRRPAATAFLTGTKSPVLIIPGVYESWRFLLPLIRVIHQTGHPVHVVDPLSNNRVPVAEGARLVARLLTDRDLHDVIVVAHSKGGLVGKHLMSLSDSRSRVSQMIAIATPFAGSRYARFMPGRTLRAFMPSNPMFESLREFRDVNSRIVSVFARYDPHIPEGSMLEGASNITVDTFGHFRVLAHTEVREMMRHLPSETV